MGNKSELIKNLLLGIAFGLCIVAFVVLYVNTKEYDVQSKVYYNVIPSSIVVDESDSNSFITAVENSSKSVVEINAVLSNGTSAGSGVIFATDGLVTYIVTNFHVIENATQFKVILNDGTTITDVQLVGGDDKQDIAVLMIKGASYRCVNIRQVTEESPIRQGETVFAIGNPLGKLGGSVTKGIISCLNREIKIDNEVMSLMQTDVAINSGNSGGGLFDAVGNLIGIVNAKVSATGVEGIAFAISIDNAINVANELIENHTHNATTLQVISMGYVKGRTELGFDATYTALMSGFFVSNVGLYVTSCDSNLQAYASGLRLYDKIVSIEYNGESKSFASTEEFKDFVALLKIGDIIKVNVDRNNESYSFNISVNQKIYQI